MSIKPPLLKAGQTIGLVAPSRVIDSKQMQEAYKLFNQWALTIKEGKSLYNKAGYFAGTDVERLDDLQTFMDDPDINAIFCARGGYGMTRIVDQLDFRTFNKKPKTIVGFSDITALHIALNNAGIQSVHGLMPVQYGNAGVEESLLSLKELLFTGKGVMNATQTEYNRRGHSTGQLVGGNLSLVAESLGTKTEIETDGKILFLEEVDEYLYKIDRMLTQLGRANKLSGLAGLVIGGFSDMKDTQIAFGMNIQQLISNHVKKFNYPIAFGFPIGHESKNLAIPVSAEAQLAVDSNKATLSF